MVGRRGALTMPFARMIEEFATALGRVHAGRKRRDQAASRAPAAATTTAKGLMNDQKNTIIAIVLSAIVLLGWQYFIGMPQVEKQRQKQQQAQQNAGPAQQRRARPRPRRPPGRLPPGTAPQPPGAPTAAPVGGQQLSREAVIAASPRHRSRRRALPARSP